MGKFLGLIITLTIFAACTPYTIEISRLIHDALVDNIGIAYFGGEAFCDYEDLGGDTEGEEMEIYVWALCGEYYRENDIPTLASAVSLPVALHFQLTDDDYELKRYQIPMDGIDFGSSILEIFPREAIQKMCFDDSDCYNERAARLEKRILNQAELFFKGK